MVWVLFLALMGATGAGAWQIYMMQESLKTTQIELRQARESLGKMTGELSATGVSISQSDSTFRSELKTVDHEIRKLWDVSNKRNREWITNNKENIEKNSKKLEYAASSAEKAIELAESGKKLAEQGNNNAEKMQDKLTELQQLIKAVTAEQLVANSDLTASMETLKVELERLGALTEEQKRIESEMSNHVAKQAELTKSFNAYRSQTNRRLQQLENSVRDLSKADQSQGLSTIQ